MVMVENTDDNENSNSIVLFCLCHVSSVMMDPPHWNGSISALRGLWPHCYHKTTKTSPSLPTWTILHVEEAGLKGHSWPCHLIAVLIPFSLVKGDFRHWTHRAVGRHKWENCFKKHFDESETPATFAEVLYSTRALNLDLCPVPTY